MKRQYSEGGDSVIIKNGRVVDPKSGTIQSGIIRLEGNLISNIYPVDYDLSGFQDEEILDATGKYIMPGFIDLHVHLRDPGLTYKEDIATGTAAAAKGGVTTICAMPNTKPVVDTVETLNYVHDKAAKEGKVRVKQLSAFTMNMEGKELVDMEAMNDAGAVAFSEDGKSVMDINLYREAMKKVAAMDALVMAHCEDKDLVGKGVLNEGVASEKYNVPGIPNSVEDVITARDMFLAGELGARLHICHCSTKGTVELMRMAKRMGFKVTAEVCPHHFTLTDADITEADSNYKMNPPLRTEEDVKALIEGLVDGTMDCISTDHAPHSKEEKSKFFTEAAFGITGLETSAALTYTALVDTGLMDIVKMAEKMSYNPAKVLGIEESFGHISEGAVADIAIFDPEAEWEVKEEEFASKASNTPYIGKVLKGRITHTIVDGKLVYEL
ncbi:MAG: dihydroorotase [Lachnospiraceae bacterium]|nr:dihydroorotase [Lachnospiraceae bacterium]